MRSSLPVLLMLACASGGDGLPTAWAPPPSAPVLEVPGQVRGLPATARLVDARLAGQTVHLVVSRVGPGPGPCLPALGVCLGLLEPTLLATGVADPAGAVTFRYTVPGFTEGVDRVWMQAVGVGPGGAGSLSAVVERGMAWPSADSDGDDLDNAAEARAGLDPFVLDSDGGGVSDAQEQLLDGSDPLSPADDRAGERACVNGVDDDGDGHRDCGDRDCLSSPWCLEDRCDDRADENGNGAADCRDAACKDTLACRELDCADLVDDDADGVTDCDDPDCFGGTCLGDVVTWLVHGTASVSLSTWRVPGGAGHTGLHTGGVPVVQVDQVTATGAVTVWVDGAPGGLPRACDGLLTSHAFLTVVDPACRVGDRPLTGLLSWDTAAQLVLSDGAPFARPVAGLGPDLDPSAEGARYEFPIEGVAPAASCPAARMWMDRDGDGAGVSEALDVFGLPGGEVWACAPTTGLVTQGGDCDDGDPTLHPGTLTLAPGRRCVDAWTDDRDADGVPAGVDGDDRDGGVQ